MDQGSIPQIPGPQVPPRLGQAPGQDKPLSVSGKKKCSHCKEELGKLMDPDLDPCNLILMKIANYCNCIMGLKCL